MGNANVKTIATKDFVDLVRKSDRKNYAIVDVRTEGEIAKHFIDPKLVKVPIYYYEVDKLASKASAVNELSSKVPQDHDLYFLCRAGSRAARACDIYTQATK